MRRAAQAKTVKVCTEIEKMRANERRLQLLRAKADQSDKDLGGDINVVGWEDAEKGEGEGRRGGGGGDKTTSALWIQVSILMMNSVYQYHHLRIVPIQVRAWTAYCKRGQARVRAH
jgi:hypothetical protein